MSYEFADGYQFRNQGATYYLIRSSGCSTLRHPEALIN
jgi:hypothetical protein